MEIATDIRPTLSEYDFNQIAVASGENINDVKTIIASQGDGLKGSIERKVKAAAKYYLALREITQHVLETYAAERNTEPRSFHLTSTLKEAIGNADYHLKALDSEAWYPRSGPPL